jgi:hypothetical protein
MWKNSLQSSLVDFLLSYLLRSRKESDSGTHWEDLLSNLVSVLSRALLEVAHPDRRQFLSEGEQRVLDDLLGSGLIEQSSVPLSPIHGASTPVEGRLPQLTPEPSGDGGA